MVTLNDNSPLSHYLVKHLQPLTEADPVLLANYVAALLKNNRPKKELQKLCTEQLHDFLREGTRTFVVKLFQALEDGTIPDSRDEHQSYQPNSVVIEPASAVNVETSSLTCFEKVPCTSLQAFCDEEEEGTDDEDVDRNHKHRRPVTRSRSNDGDGQDAYERKLYRKRSMHLVNGEPLQENHCSTSEQHGGSFLANTQRGESVKYERRIGRTYGYGANARMTAEGNQRGVSRRGALFRGDTHGQFVDYQGHLTHGILGRGTGVTGLWSPLEQRPLFDGSDCSQSILPRVLPSSNLYSGRALSSRGNPSLSPWKPDRHLSGIGSRYFDQSLPLKAGMRGGRVVQLSAGTGIAMNMGLGMTIGRPRCPDFEERGYCLRGDLCSMEHGANRIVVEDVQSLSQLNLSVTLPSGRGMGSISVPVNPQLSFPAISSLGLDNRVARETLDMSGLLNVATLNAVAVEPDHYDPDQPLWNRDRLSVGIKRFPSLNKGLGEQDTQRGAPDCRGGHSYVEEPEAHLKIATLAGLRDFQLGPYQWNQIGHPYHGEVKGEGGARAFSIPDDAFNQQHTGDTTSRHGNFKRESNVKEESNIKTSGMNAPHDKDRPIVLEEARAKDDVGMQKETGDRDHTGMRGGKAASSAVNSSGRNMTEGNTGLGTERAQRTLYVGCIPNDNNRRELLLAHFQKFGEVVDIRIPPHRDRAFVQFSRREDAESALFSPDAVMGNRFIRLSWAKRDSILDSGKANTSLAPSGPFVRTQLPFVKEKEKTDSCISETGDIFLDNSAIPNVQPFVPVQTAVKKHEELEHMKEEIRKKQEELAQKRDEFRRRLDRLSRQGVGTKGSADTEQSIKRPKLAVLAGGPYFSKSVFSDASAMQVTGEIGQSCFQFNAGPQKFTTGHCSALNPDSRLVASVSMPQPLHSGARTPISRPGSGVWGSGGYKLDNRTTVVRILPPFPDGLLDIATLEDHFANYGELICVELEDAECQRWERNSKLTGKSAVRITFNTRHAAEKAFVQGKSFQGFSLQLSWFTPSAYPAGIVTPTGSVQINAGDGDNAREREKFQSSSTKTLPSHSQSSHSQSDVNSRLDSAANGSSCIQIETDHGSLGC